MMRSTTAPCARCGRATATQLTPSAPSPGALTPGPLGGYSYLDPAHKHAATSAGPNAYGYDANGALVSRTEGGATYQHGHDLQGRHTSVTVGGVTTTFVYDGDGQLVAKQVGGTTVTHYAAGGLFEKDPSTGTTKKYYRLGGRLVAVRDSATGLHFLHQDHLGSTSLQTSQGGAHEGTQLRGPFGQPWFASGSLGTDLQYTGQRSLEAAQGPQPSLGSLLHYGARWYSPVLGRFLHPDTIVPNPGNPQDLNRYGYVRNNPVRLVDPTGHVALDGQSLWDQAEDVRASFVGQWGDAAAEHWDAEHNAALVGAGLVTPATTVDPVPHAAAEVLAEGAAPLAAARLVPGALDELRRRSLDNDCFVQGAVNILCVELPFLGETVVLVMTPGGPRLLGGIAAMTPGRDTGGGAPKGDDEFLMHADDWRQHRRLSGGDLRRLEEQTDRTIHEIKREYGDHTGALDLYKDRANNVYIRPKKGARGPGEFTGYNLDE